MSSASSSSPSVSSVKPSFMYGCPRACKRFVNCLGLTASGAKILPYVMAGSKEDAETVSAFFQDMPRRGLGDPPLVVSDGAAGIFKAIGMCFPRSARQRCLAHRMRNLAAKMPENLWSESKARVTAAYQAPSRAIALDLARAVVAD